MNQEFKTRNTEITDKLLSSPHKLSLLNETKEKSMSSSERIDARQSGKCQKTVIGQRAVQVVEHLEFQKVCALWVPRLLTEGTNLEKNKTFFTTA